MIKINPNQICSIIISYKEESYWYTYKTEKKFLFFIIRKEGFYDYIGYYHKDLDLNKYYCENNIVYDKPYIMIKMSNKTIEYKYFNSKELLDIYLENFKDIPFVVLHEN